jgi:eukaryotic-like serine/threonine-protein kinase
LDTGAKPIEQWLDSKAAFPYRAQKWGEVTRAMNASSTASGFKYSAFLSYSHHDRRWAEWLQRALETYRVPFRLVGTQTASGLVTRRLAPVCRDRSDMRSSPDLGANIKEALLASANLIVICSPSASTSRWVNEEIDLFLRLGRADRIFCLIVAGEPNASESEECFAPALRFVYDADGQAASQRREPTAADVRPGRDGKTDAKLKLIAGLFDVDLDVLKQREQRRRVQRMTAITSLALVVMLITTGLAIEAHIQRNRAVAERQTAERRQKQAENLVGFMLGDLNDKLRQVQRLDILEAVDNRAVDYFRSLPTQDVTNQTLAERAKALQMIGRVRADQGNLPAALESYRAASALAAELMRRAPGDPEREAAFAETLNFIGNAYWFQGDLDHALASFKQAVELLELATTGRATDARQAELASARTNVGRVLEAQGDLAGAKALYEMVLGTFKTMVSRDSAARWQSDLADAYDSLGKVDLEQGDLRKAIAAYHDVRHIRFELASRTPHDHAVQEDLLISDAILGRALALCGADQAAENYVRQAVDAAAALVTYDSTQVDWREELADYSRLLGGLARGAGRLDEAARLDSAALRVLGDLVETDKTNATWRREMASAQIESARLKLARGTLADADYLLDLALPAITHERAASPNDRNLKLLESQAHIVLGQIAALQHDRAAAQQQFTEARDAVAAAARVGADPNFLAAWASALLLLNDASARPVIDRLASIGYQTPDFQRVMLTARQSYPLKTLEARCGVEQSPVTLGRKF